MIRRTTARSLSGPLLGLALFTGCQEPTSQHPEATEPSPNASILPAPLSSAAIMGRSKRFADAGVHRGEPDRLVETAPRPIPLRDDEQPPLDVPTPRDTIGLELAAVWRWFDLPNAAGVGESDADAIRTHKQKTALKVSVVLSFSGKMRYRLESDAFALPFGSEIRASRESYGYTLIWPDRRTYRVIVPGMVGTLLAERRADASPLVSPKLGPEAASILMDQPTQRVELTTAKGRLLMEQAEMAGVDGASLCRLLVELIAAKPTTPACSEGRVPLRADYHWAGGGRLAFEVLELQRRQDLSLTELSLVPGRAIFKVGELPPQTASAILTPSELSAWRTRAAPGKAGAGAPAQGLLAVNRTYVLKYLVLEGVPVAWVLPDSHVEILGPKPGRYSVAWRDFYGTEITSANVLQLPARVSVGNPADAGSTQP